MRVRFGKVVILGGLLMFLMQGHCFGLELKKDLLDAVKSDDRNRINELISKGADINYTTDDGSSLFIFAYDNYSLAEYLLQKGLDPNGKVNVTVSQITPEGIRSGQEMRQFGLLERAITLGPEDKAIKYCKLLVKYGAKIDPGDYVKTITPLSLAIFYKFFLVFDYLLSLQPDNIYSFIFQYRYNSSKTAAASLRIGAYLSANEKERLRSILRKYGYMRVEIEKGWSFVPVKDVSSGSNIGYILKDSFSDSYDSSSVYFGARGEMPDSPYIYSRLYTMQREVSRSYGEVLVEGEFTKDNIKHKIRARLYNPRNIHIVCGDDCFQ